MRTGRDVAAGAALHERRVAATIEQKDALLTLRESCRDRLLEGLADHAAESIVRLAVLVHPLRGADIDDLDGWKAPTADALGQRQQMILPTRGVHPSLETRRSATEYDDRAFRAGAHDRHFTSMITRCLALFVARLVFLVDNDRAELGERREDGRPRADGDALFAAPQREPGVIPLAVAQCTVEDGDTIAEGRTKAIHSLRCQRDLGHENDRALASLVHDGAKELDIDERLAASGDAVQQKGLAWMPSTQRIDCVLLRFRRNERRHRRCLP